MRFKIVSVILFFFITASLFALEIGDRPPNFEVKKWLNGNGELYPENIKTPINVIIFWTPTDNSSYRVLNFIQEQKEAFKESDVQFFAITTSGEPRVREFLKKDKNLDVQIGIDTNSRTLKEYLSENQSIPAFFIFGRNKRLLWTGGPVESTSVLLKVMAGTFNYDTQKQIEALREKMEKAAVTFKFSEKLKYANDILKIDPTDRIAAEAIIDNYISNNEIDKCLSFINKTRDEASWSKYLQYYYYLTELDVASGLINETGVKTIDSLTRDFTISYQNTPKALNNYAIRVLNTVPFQLIPVKQIIDMSQQAVKISKEFKENDRTVSFCLQTEAKAYYTACDIKKAVEVQKEAVKLLKDKEDVDNATVILNYYNSINSLKLN